MSKALNNKIKLNGFVDVKADFGAKGNGSTDDTAAIQAAINSITTGTIFFPPGRYIVSSTLSVNKGGISLVGAAPAGQGSVTGSAISELVASGSNTVMLRYGDPAEATGAGSHIYPSGTIEKLAITGNVSTTSGIRVYNIGCKIRDCYVSNVVGTNGIGIWMKNAWLSSVHDTVIQSNGKYDLWLDASCNSFTVADCAFLTGNTTYGINIVGGSNSVTFLNCDFEGKLRGINIDLSSSSLDNLAVMGCNFESNVGYSIIVVGAQPLNNSSLTNLRCNGTGQDISLNFHNALRIDQVSLNNCNLAFPQAGQTGDIGKLYLAGTAALTGFTSSQRFRKNVELWYEDNSTVGVLNYAYDGSLYNVLELNLTAACTSVVLTINNTANRPAGDEILVMVGNTSTATVGGAITFPAAFKKSAAAVIPSASTRSFFRFVKDPNNIWWETSRTVNVA